MAFTPAFSVFEVYRVLLRLGREGIGVALDCFNANTPSSNLQRPRIHFYMYMIDSDLYVHSSYSRIIHANDISSGDCMTSMSV